MNYTNELPPLGRIMEEVPRPKEEFPHPNYFLQQHRIEIEFMSRGAIIRVGCKSIPFENINEMMNELNKYVENPSESRQRWEKMLP